MEGDYDKLRILIKTYAYLCCQSQDHQIEILYGVIFHSCGSRLGAR